MGRDRNTFSWELGAEDFRALLESSSRFRAFCTDHLAALLERSQRALRAEAAEGLTDSAGMLAPLRTALSRPPVSCLPQTPVADVLRTMQAEHVGSMVVTDAIGMPLGIFTTVDVLRYAASPGARNDGPIGGLMSPNPITLAEDATLMEAALAMARHGIRHVIVTRDAKLSGVISERDLFARQRVSLSRTAGRIAAAGGLGELVEAAADVRRLARHLLAHGIAAEPLTGMISALNDSLSRRVIELARVRRAPGGPWCWLALGSEGRVEQTFATDQDNALIIDSQEKDLFLEFADEVNRALEACGFPLCKGEIMARNPRWCLTPQAWRSVFDGWIRNPQPEALLNASIFFDLRALAGAARLAGELRESVLAQTRANAAFCRAMAEDALRVTPPLGLVRDFAAAEIDLKTFGARPFVDAARVLALAEGNPETATAARLRATGESAAVDAFHFIQGLRLKHGNVVRVEALSAIDRRVLKEAFRLAALLQARLRLDYRL